MDGPILRCIDRLQSSRRTDALHVFDAGCGNGAFLKVLMERGYQVAGCDASQSGVAHAKLACSDRIRIEQMSVYDNLADTFGDSWDVVIATEVIEHLYDPRLFIAQVVRLLRPNGVLILSTPFHGYWKNLLVAVTGKMDAHFTALWDGGHIKFWSYRTLTQLLQEFALSDFRFAGAGRIPGLWKSMIVTCRKRN